jgi:serine protease AprX
LALVTAFLLAISVLVATPALAAKGGKDGGGDPSTTTTTVADTTTTTVASDSGGFDQWEDASSLGSYSPGLYPGSMYWITTKATGAVDFWNAGYTGAGIDVALIDTGVVPVDGLRSPGKVINGADLSFESQADNLRYLDTYGHGTHLAGIIAGRADSVTSIQNASNGDFLGMAPDARIVNVKVADAHGAVDVTQVIAAIDWVIEHRNDNGMNIRVINLSYGTDGTQAYEVDPLSLAVERAWNAGIVVVVAAGNDGNAAPLRNPAANPFVIAVGAAENANNHNRIDDDTVPAFSSCGTTNRFVDLVAHGKSIVSLRSPGSYADQFYPQAVVADGYFLGSGSSQAAAIVTGAVALLLDQRPELNPDQVKQLLAHDTAVNLGGVNFMCQGGGNLNLAAAFTAPTPTASSADQTYQPSEGGGSLEAARGSDHVSDNGVPLEGEIDIMGNPWYGYNCTTTTTGKGRDRVTTVSCDSLWNGGDFNGASWSGASWSGASWSGASWSGASWSGASWSGASWSSKTWSGASWSGASWSGASWSGASWSGASWSGASWSGVSWD